MKRKFFVSILMIILFLCTISGKTIYFDKQFEKNTIIGIDTLPNISSIKVFGRVTFDTVVSNGVARIVLVDDKMNEYLVMENDNLEQNIILIDPDISSIEVNKVTSAYYITPIDPANGPRFIKTEIKTNTADAIFHELGHIIFQGQSQDKVIIFNNKVRKILKLKSRPFNEEHNKTIR